MQLSPLALPGDRDKDYTKYGSFRAALFVCEKKYSTQILPRYDIYQNIIHKYSLPTENMSDHFYRSLRLTGL